MLAPTVPPTACGARAPLARARVGAQTGPSRAGARAPLARARVGAQTGPSRVGARALYSNSINFNSGTNNS